MEILKQAADSPLFLIKDIEEDTMIGLYNTCLNYKNYILTLLKLSDPALMRVAPGLNPKTVRSNLKMHLLSCDSFIEAWDKLIHVSETNAQHN